MVSAFPFRLPDRSTYYETTQPSKSSHSAYKLWSTTIRRKGGHESCPLHVSRARFLISVFCLRFGKQSSGTASKQASQTLAIRVGVIFIQPSEGWRHPLLDALAALLGMVSEMTWKGKNGRPGIFGRGNSVTESILRSDKKCSGVRARKRNLVSSCLEVLGAQFYVYTARLLGFCAG